MKEDDPKEEHFKSEDPNAIPTKEGDPEGEFIGDYDHDKEPVEEEREPEIVSFP